MSKRKNPGWRDRAASNLLLEYLDQEDRPGLSLILGEPLPEVAHTLAAEGHNAVAWNRRAFHGSGGEVWPPPGPFSLATLRLPRGKDELCMSLHAAASVLRPGSSLLVYGAKDEGIQGAQGSLAELLTDVGTVAVGGHCRVLKGVRGSEVPGIRRSLGEWREEVDLGYPDLPSDWVSYPGVFAHGRLDLGTRLLLDSLPAFPAGARVLDYGSGSGVVGYVAQKRGQNLVVELLDVDAVALEAAKENVPGGVFHLRDGLPSEEGGPFDGIVSNPPFHRGKAEDPEMIASLVRGAPFLLKPKGRLVLVAQARLPLQDVLREHFRDVAVLAEDSTFRVWKGGKPRKEKRRG